VSGRRVWEFALSSSPLPGRRYGEGARRLLKEMPLKTGIRSFGSHVQCCIWELVPHSPELSHFGCGAQGDTDVSIHAPDRGSYYDSMLAEVLDDLLGRRCVFIITKFVCVSTRGRGCSADHWSPRRQEQAAGGRAIRNGATSSNESDHISLQSRKTGEITREQ
jgi:hypothetical protein